VYLSAFVKVVFLGTLQALADFRQQFRHSYFLSLGFSAITGWGATANGVLPPLLALVENVLLSLRGNHFENLHGHLSQSLIGVSIPNA